MTSPLGAAASEAAAAADKTQTREALRRASGHVWGPEKPSKDAFEVSSPDSNASEMESESSY